MKQPSDQLKLGAILSYVSTGLNMAVQLLYTPLMIRLLGQSEYGLYTLVGSVVSYLSLFSLGFTGAYLRFYSQRRAKNDEEGIARLNGMFLTVFCVMSLAALVCGMALLRFPRALFGNKLTAREVGERLGISSNMVGILTNRHGLKTEEYGAWFNDKARGHDKEVQSFRYYEKVVAVLEAILRDKDKTA